MELQKIIQSEEQIPKETTEQNDKYLEHFAKASIHSSKVLAKKTQDAVAKAQVQAAK